MRTPARAFRGYRFVVPELPWPIELTMLRVPLLGSISDLPPAQSSIVLRTLRIGPGSAGLAV